MSKVKAKIEKCQQALDAFLKNPYWKGIYEGAPPKAKQLYEISFASGKNLISEEDAHKEVAAIYSQFSPGDWDYLIEHTTSRMCKWGYRMAREKYLRKNG